MGEQPYPVEGGVAQSRRVAHRGASGTRRPGSRAKGLRRLPPVRGYGEYVEALSGPRLLRRPCRGFRRNRERAVDHTPINGHGEELLMPPDFDDFGERPGHGYEDLPDEAIRNRDSRGRRWKATASLRSQRSGGTTTARSLSGSSC